MAQDAAVDEVDGGLVVDTDARTVPNVKEDAFGLLPGGGEGAGRDERGAGVCTRR